MTRVVDGSTRLSVVITEALQMPEEVCDQNVALSVNLVLILLSTIDYHTVIRLLVELDVNTLVCPKIGL